ncbi:winged helix-turn-helix domain-containing protein [Agrobacterium tumefaciens]|uniref:winged helix-turn-helix domain-containing protein n=1 Tax=Agrobacterium tumefaciens TaxID=358 RepID=UPI001571E771|nr:helix-turn-helix domain-containing protein [Agrobacterium tumefaciens]NSX90115.1 helix-turn-helix domain-containing protein [Agrobacterium tumefaciens]
MAQVVENITQPSRRIIMAMLSEKPGKAVYRDRIIDRIYGGRADGGPEAADHVLMVIVSQLRRQIEPFGWTITNSRGGAGNLAQWRLIPVEVTP